MRNQGRISVILMTDMSAAFNVIKSEVLLTKMRHYGFDKWTCKLVEDYLSGRSTKTKIGNFLSKAVTLNSGVGEGSVLGPAIFAMGLCDVGLVAKDTVKICKELGLDVDVPVVPPRVLLHLDHLWTSPGLAQREQSLGSCDLFRAGQFVATNHLGAGNITTEISNLKM